VASRKTGRTCLSPAGGRDAGHLSGRPDGTGRDDGGPNGSILAFGDGRIGKSRHVGQGPFAVATSRGKGNRLNSRGDVIGAHVALHDRLQHRSFDLCGGLGVVGPAAPTKQTGGKSAAPAHKPNPAKPGGGRLVAPNLELQINVVTEGAFDLDPPGLRLELDRLYG